MEWYKGWERKVWSIHSLITQVEKWHLHQEEITWWPYCLTCRACAVLARSLEIRNVGMLGTGGRRVEVRLPACICTLTLIQFVPGPILVSSIYIYIESYGSGSNISSGIPLQACKGQSWTFPLKKGEPNVEVPRSLSSECCLVSNCFSLLDWTQHLVLSEHLSWCSTARIAAEFL